MLLSVSQSDRMRLRDGKRRQYSFQEGIEGAFACGRHVVVAGKLRRACNEMQDGRRQRRSSAIVIAQLLRPLLPLPLLLPPLLLLPQMLPPGHQPSTIHYPAVLEGPLCLAACDCGIHMWMVQRSRRC